MAWLRAGLLAATVVLAGAAPCVKVSKPSSDSTPPTLSWHVENRATGVTVDYAGAGTVTGRKGDSFRVTLTAEDPQGIQTITLGGGYTQQCASGSTGDHTIADFVRETRTVAPRSDGKVVTQIDLTETYTPYATCFGSFTLQGASFSLGGTGTNYANGVTSGSLRINISP